jgi:hypothetical protein
MLTTQKEYHELKEIRAQLDEAIQEMTELGDSLVQDLELNIGDGEEKATQLLEVSMWMLKAKLQASLLESSIRTQREKLIAELN